MLRYITKAVDFFIGANVDHARQKRRLNSISKDYSQFRKEFFNASDTEILRDKRYNYDKWVSINDLTLLFHKASNAPVHMTQYDKQQHLAPFLNRIRNRIQNGEITAFRYGDVDSLDDYSIRAARVWETIMQSDLPDGGLHNRLASYHNRDTKNDEVPRPIFIDGQQRDEWLNLKLPLLYALATAEDAQYQRESHKAYKYNRAEDGEIKTMHNNPYMP